MAGDLFDAAAAQNTASQREALAALATGGSKARDAYLAAQQAQTADKASVMRDILDRSTQIGAPEAGALHQAQAAPRMDLRATALAGSSTSNQALLGSLAAANKNYFDQVAAAMPIVRERSLMERDARAAKEAEEQAGIAAILKQLGGVGMAQGFAETYQGTQRFEPQVEVPGAKPGTFNFNGVLKPREATRDESAEEFGEQVGLPPGAGRALIGPAKAEPKPTQTAHRADVTKRVAQHASANTYDTFLDVITGRPKTETTPAVPAATSYAAAMKRVNGLTDEQLKAVGVSKDVLVRWLTDYFAV